MVPGDTVGAYRSLGDSGVGDTTAADLDGIDRHAGDRSVSRSAVLGRQLHELFGCRHGDLRHGLPGHGLDGRNDLPLPGGRKRHGGHDKRLHGSDQRHDPALQRDRWRDVRL